MEGRQQEGCLAHVHMLPQGQPHACERARPRGCASLGRRGLRGSDAQHVPRLLPLPRASSRMLCSELLTQALVLQHARVRTTPRGEGRRGAAFTAP